MARMKKNVGDHVSGKIGNVVFYQMYGRTYVRAAPVVTEHTFNEEQKLRRKRIVRVSELWRALKSDQFSGIWNLAAQQMNGYAWFVKANMPALEMDGTLIDACLLKVSDGKLTMAEHLTVEPNQGDPSAIGVSWQNDPHAKAEGLNDQLMAMTYADNKFSPITDTGLKRKDMKGTFPLPALPANASYLYLFFASQDRKSYSGSTGFKLGE